MKRIRPLLIVAGVAALLIAGWMVFGARALSVYYTGVMERAREEGRLDAASDAAESLVKLEPDNRGLRMRVSEVLAEGGRFSRAEYHLLEALALGGPRQSELFAALSALYVRQDKLMDAVKLFDSARGLSAGDAAAMRPPMPSPDATPGIYERPVTLSFTVPENCVCYYSLTEEYPSICQPADEPVSVPPGETVLRAVTVDANGVVSELWSGVYTLNNLNFPVTFLEPALEQAVRDQIGRPDGEMYSRDLTGIEELVIAEENDYHTLEDLTLLPRLRILSLKGVSGSDCDISALAGLMNLTGLRLENMGIDSVDLSALGGLAQLQILKLPGNYLTSLTSLSGLTALVTLELQANSIIDVSPLTSLILLKELDLSTNSIQDLLPLAPLTALERVVLTGNRIVSMDGLSNKKALRVLYVSDNRINDLGALNGLFQMEILDASRNSIMDITPLRLMTDLTELKLSGNQIEDIAAIQPMKALVTLELASNQIQSVGMLQQCAVLETLVLDKNEIATVEPLRNLSKLRELRVENNKLTTLSPLLGCVSLKVVYAFGNKLTVDSGFSAKGITVYAN